MRLDRHYMNANYTIPLAEKRSLNLDFSGYHTEWDKDSCQRYSFITW